MKKVFALAACAAALISINASAAAADENDRRVQVQNRSDQAIHYLYASPVTTNNWEEDLLGEGTIAAGASVTANIDNGTTECNYDFKVVMANGREHITRRVNVCVVSRLVVTNSGAAAQ